MLQYINQHITCSYNIMIYNEDVLDIGKNIIILKKDYDNTISMLYVSLLLI